MKDCYLSDKGVNAAAEYALEFHTLEAKSMWDELLLKVVYCQGLNGDIKIEMACHDDAVTLDKLINLSIKLDNILQNHRQKRSALPLRRHCINDTRHPPH